MKNRRIIVVGGGAAGFFAAIKCAETDPHSEVIVMEKGPRFLQKVSISGGGRCNVTHACFDGRELARRYPRGGRELIGAFQRFQARDTVAWFESRGVQLKEEPDGRMFPVTDSSQTIVDCLVRNAQSAGVTLLLNSTVEGARRRTDGGFELRLGSGDMLCCDRLMLASGGCRSTSAGELPQSLGHALESPVPSLFTFHIDTGWLHALAGVSVDSAEVSVPGTLLRERGPLLATHSGLSGPVILRTSAWGARILSGFNYQFPLVVNWLPEAAFDSVLEEFQRRRESVGARLVANVPLAPLPARLWEALLGAAGVGRDVRWSSFSREQQKRVARQLLSTGFSVSGKSLNRDEFVTCGGVRLVDVNFKTMESRIYPGLYFAGELLDIDGITGGFNFQAAWTTGWLAGRAMGSWTGASDSPAV
jgi:hypothetical protein